MKKKFIAFAAVLLAIPQLAATQDHDLEAQLRPFLAPPELVMRYQRQLNITDDQREAIRGKINELQSAVQDLQWQLQDLNQALVEIVSGDSVDVNAAVLQFEQVLDAEASIKRNHMRLLLEIRNVLNREQRRQLQVIMEEMVRREMREGPPRRREDAPEAHEHRPVGGRLERIPG
jgi:Spy/CpxP family protein refolding chaperone